MNSSLSQSSPFDSIRQVDKNGQEFWSARDLQELLGYSDWRNFEDSIEKAMISCEISGQSVANYWVVGVTKPIISGKGRVQEVKDYHMTRYACYLTAMNGDVRKPEIAAAQRYFVVKAREAELSQTTHDHINEAHRKIRDFNMWRTEKLRFTVEEKANALALSGMLRNLGFAANAFLDSSLAHSFKPWCAEQGYDMLLVRKTERARIVGYELNEDGLTYDWEKPIKRHTDSYPEDPFGLAWSVFLVEYYWPEKFLPYITRKYKGEERAQNIESGIKVISFYTGYTQAQITEKSNKRGK